MAVLPPHRPARVLKSRWARARPWLAQAGFIAAVVLGMNGWQTRSLLNGEHLPGGFRPTVGGGPVDLAALFGRPTVVAVWAPWCGVCAATSGNLRLLQKLVGEHAQVLSIAMDYPNLGSVQAYMKNHAVRYPVVLGDGPLGEALHVQAFPTFFFLDAQGKVRHASVGYTTTLGMLFRLFV